MAGVNDDDYKIAPATSSMLNSGNIKGAAEFQCTLFGNSSLLKTRTKEDIERYANGFKNVWSHRSKHEQNLWRQHAKCYLVQNFHQVKDGEMIWVIDILMGWQDPDSNVQDMVDMRALNLLGCIYQQRDDYRNEKKAYEKAMAIRLKHDDPVELPELLVNYGNMLAKHRVNDPDALNEAMEFYRRAKKCTRVVCGPFEDDRDNQVTNKESYKNTADDALQQVYRQLLKLEQKAEKETSSRQSQIAKRLQAKLSQRSSETNSVQQAALDRINGTPEASSVNQTSEADPENPSIARKKKNRRRVRKTAKQEVQTVPVSPADDADFEDAMEQPDLEEQPAPETDTAKLSELLELRDEELREARDELEEVRMTLSEMILFCDRQQSTIDDLRQQLAGKKTNR